MHTYTIRCAEHGTVYVNVNSDFSGDAILSWNRFLNVEVTSAQVADDRHRTKVRVRATALLRGEADALLTLSTPIPHGAIMRTVAYMLTIYLTQKIRSFADNAWMPQVGE